VLVFLGVLVLAHPVVFDGPGPDPVYTYEASVVTESPDGADAVVEAVPRATLVYGTEARLVRAAAADPVTPSTPDERDAVERLAAVRYASDDVNPDGGTQFYAVSVANDSGTLRLATAPVSAATVLDALAVSRSRLSEPLARALDGPYTTQQNVAPRVAAVDDSYVLITRTADVRPDPYRYHELAAYALAVASIVVGSLSLLDRRRR
jgi:hypothetical protein